VEKLGVDKTTSSFVLPMGMTINMNGTAIMQVIATLFIAGVAGYEITLFNLVTISLLALLASIGTPAAPGAGAIILFTILSGMGYSNEIAISAYAIILGINRPIEMLVTSLNVVGDSAVAIFVSKSEGTLDVERYSELNEDFANKKIKI
ncbi:MAG: dicarboxylate/amino acid:cation symporter, partial [Fusobacteriaceae bacterium]